MTTTTTIRDGVILLLVLVKKSAAKTHIYYSIYISLLFSSHEVLETNNVREREKRFRSVLSSAPSRCFFLPFFHACMENNEIFFVPAKTRKNVSSRKGEEKENFLLFFDAYDEYIIIAHARIYKKSSL